MSQKAYETNVKTTSKFCSSISSKIINHPLKSVGLITLSYRYSKSNATLETDIRR